jgi:hypothetical protein
MTAHALGWKEGGVNGMFRALIHMSRTSILLKEPPNCDPDTLDCKRRREVLESGKRTKHCKYVENDDDYSKVFTPSTFLKAGPENVLV